MSSPQHILRLAVFGSNALKASVGGPPPRETAGEAVTQHVPGQVLGPEHPKAALTWQVFVGEAPCLRRRKAPTSASRRGAHSLASRGRLHRSSP